MREMTACIRFTTHSLGNARNRDDSRFHLLRDVNTSVIFLASWHLANMRFASKVLGRHQDVVSSILWDISVDAALGEDRWYRRYYEAGKRTRYVLHESFVPGQCVGFNCIIPAAINDDDFWQLLSIAGRYKGLSHYKPGQYGFYTVETLNPRRGKNEGHEAAKPHAPA